MKTLMLLRHAKSSWDDSEARDFDRSISDRGKRDAPKVAEMLVKRGVLPDLIVSSPAVRARQTIEAVVDAAKLTAIPQFDDGIYGATSPVLMRLIRRLPDSAGTVMLVGHNPTFEEMVARLSGHDEHMPTAALACIQFQVGRWEDVEDGQGKLLWLVSPKHPG